MTTRWGFLGAGFVAARAMAPAVHAAADAELVCVASREVDRARSLGAPSVTSDYAAVIADPQIDAVYISLTNEAHLKWTLAALDGGKHVLCEKPLTTSAADARAIDAAVQRSGTHVVEALWYRWHPRYQATLEALRDGSIGAIDHIDAEFSFTGVPPGNYRLDPSRGGGAVLDVGPYVVDIALSTVAASTGQAVSQLGIEVDSRMVVHNEGPDGVDMTTRARLLISGVAADVLMSIDSAPAQRLEISADRGALVWAGGEAFTNWHTPSRLERHRDGAIETLDSFPDTDPYQLMVEQFGRTVRGDEPSVMPMSDSIALADVLEQLRAPQS